MTLDANKNHFTIYDTITEINSARIKALHSNSRLIEPYPGTSQLRASHANINIRNFHAVMSYTHKHEIKSYIIKRWWLTSIIAARRPTKV